MCFCGSGIEFTQCCALVIQQQNAQSPEQLMRSRFSAYCTKQADYLEQSWHPSQRAQNRASDILEFAQSVHFVKLEIKQASSERPAGFLLPTLNVTAEQFGYVEFVASFIAQDKLQHLHEISRFVQENEQWFYLDGTILPSAAEKLGRNDPCPCGSGLKYKACRQHNIAS